jgi:hypothetical protein
LPDNFGAPDLRARWTRFARKQLPRIISNLRRILEPSNVLASPSISKLLPSKLISWHRRNIFRTVYERHLWGNDHRSRFYSGNGSRGIAASTYISKMSLLLQNYARAENKQITVVDLGCGDFEIGRELVAHVESMHYIGCDIVPELIAHHSSHNADSRVTFRNLDIASDNIPCGDVCLARQVFQHLSNAEIKTILGKLKAFKKVYVTEGYPSIELGPVNPDKPCSFDVRYDWKTGRGRGVELDKEPYNIPTHELFRVTSPPSDILITFEIEWQSKQSEGALF